MSNRVIREQRTVYRVPGGRSRFTVSAAYREAARVAIREACHCYYEPDTGYNEQCRFHGGGDPDAHAIYHRNAEHDDRFDREGQPINDDTGRGYYLLVRERLARWLRWAAREEVGHG